MTRPDSPRQDQFQALVAYLSRLGVSVAFANAAEEGPMIAQLQSKLITVNTRNRDELSCMFTVAHLFGHLVQFSNGNRYAHLTSRVEGAKPLPVDESFRAEFYAYEVEAFRIGKGLMLAAMKMDEEMDSKYTLFMETDFGHFWHYITTGTQGDMAAFNRMLDEAYTEWAANKRRLVALPHPATISGVNTSTVNVV